MEFENHFFLIEERDVETIRLAKMIDQLYSIYSFEKEKVANEYDIFKSKKFQRWKRGMITKFL